MVEPEVLSPRTIVRVLMVMAIAAVAMAPPVLSDVYAQTLPEESLFVRASVDNSRPYLGQQITYIFKIYQPPGLTLSSGQVQYGPPGFAGFWNSHPVKQDNFTEVIDSNEYRVIELRTVLFPSIVGTVAIDPAALVVSIGTTEGESILESSPVPVEVRPSPAGAPAEFTGAVGRFDISTEVDAVTGVVNEPVRLTVMLSGDGNIEALPDPAWPEFAGWRVIESPANVSSQVDDGQVTGSRAYGIVLVPERAGEITIPEIVYVYFDPNLEQYVQTATPSILMPVAGADGLTDALPPPVVAGASDQEGLEMRPIKPVPSSLRRLGRERTDSAIYWAAWGIPLLAIAGAIVWRRRQAALEAALASSRQQNALRNARTALSRAVASGVDPRVAAADAVLSYLTDRLSKPMAGLTREALCQRLQDAGVPPDIASRAENILAAGEAAGYTPMAAHGSESGNPAEDAVQFLTELEGTIDA